MRIETRVDYLDLDGNVVFSDPITGSDHKLREIDEDDDLIWDIVWFGVDDEFSNEIVELGRVSRVTEA